MKIFPYMHMREHSIYKAYFNKVKEHSGLLVFKTEHLLPTSLLAGIWKAMSRQASDQV